MRFGNFAKLEQVKSSTLKAQHSNNRATEIVNKSGDRFWFGVRWLIYVPVIYAKFTFCLQAKIAKLYKIETFHWTRTNYYDLFDNNKLAYRVNNSAAAAVLWMKGATASYFRDQVFATRTRFIGVTRSLSTGGKVYTFFIPRKFDLEREWYDVCCR